MHLWIFLITAWWLWAFRSRWGLGPTVWNNLCFQGWRKILVNSCGELWKQGNHCSHRLQGRKRNLSVCPLYTREGNCCDLQAWLHVVNKPLGQSSEWGSHWYLWSGLQSSYMRVQAWFVHGNLTLLVLLMLPVHAVFNHIYTFFVSGNSRVSHSSTSDFKSSC